MTTKHQETDRVNQMKRTQPIPMKELLAVALFASKDMSRYILNGVHIEATKDEVILVATNGTSLSVICSKPNQTELFDLQPFKTTIPTEAIETIRKSCGKDSLVEIALDPELITITCGPESDRTTVQCKPIEGNYPNWRQVVPVDGDKSIQSVEVDWRLLESFTKAAKLLGRDGGIQMGFSQGYESPIGVRIAGVHNFYGVLMPMRQGKDEEPLRVTPPNWIVQ